MPEQSVHPLNFLVESPLLAGLEPQAARRLLELGQVCRCSAGEVVVAEGDQGDGVYLLGRGAVSIGTQRQGGQSVVLARLGERGDFFGEVSLVDPGPRSATVRADTDAVLLKVTVPALQQLFAEFPQAEAALMRNIARTLAHRLREANLRFRAALSS